MFFQPPHLQSEQFQVSRAAPCFNKLSTVWQEAARRCGCWPAILCKILSGRFAIMASNRAPLPPSGRRVASPRNNSAALLAASMSMGEAVSNSRVGTGTAGGRPGSTRGKIEPYTNVEVDDEVDRLRKKRQSIFKSKYEIDEKVASRNKALINLVKVGPYSRLLARLEAVCAVKKLVACLCWQRSVHSVLVLDDVYPTCPCSAVPCVWWVWCIKFVVL